MKTLITILLCLSTSLLLAQTYNMTNGSVSTCSGTFYDNGGTGDYSNSQNLTYTICPSTPGSYLTVNFTSFSLENSWDYLYIYDGSTTGAPLIGTYTGTGSPGAIVSSTVNGCLTFRFTSDGSFTYSGWVATISCSSTPLPPGISMSNGSINTCGATFYDNGGASGNYSNSQNLTYTICPDTPGAFVSAAFTSFNLENNWDFLYIYDGSTTGAPLIGTYTGTTSPGTIIASIGNATGCLTFNFTSDGSVDYAGWAATISCINPCQTITASVVSTNPAPDGDGIIRLCQGENIQFNGSATFSDSGAGAVYTWNFGDGNSATGTTVNYSYPAGGGYSAHLQVSDPNGCVAQSAERLIEVSTTPTILTSATPATLCDNQSSALNANVTMTPFVQNCTPPVSGVTFLPDGSGVDYSTSIVTDCYPPSATITSANDFINLCLELEHSFLGDLSMRFRCPNGQVMTLKAYPGGLGTYLGNPIDDVTSGPGTGWVYCFTPSATTLLVDGATALSGTPAWNSIVAGNYRPVDPFSNLIGCPLNGTWTIEITDHLGLDDGYIFEWGFDLAASLSNVTSFTPTIVSQGWVAAPTLTPTGSTTATATPTSMGTPCYTYQVVDNFGCTYTQNQCLTVNCTTLGVELLSFEAVSNSDNGVDLNWVTSMERDNSYFEIQRMKEDLSWEVIGSVDSKGNSTVNQEYEAFDDYPLNGDNYYRLKQYDFNGSFSYSDIRMVTFNSGPKLYPNPATDEVRVINISSDEVHEAFILDAFGKVVDRIPVLNTGIKVDVLNYSSGIYYIQIGQNTLKFVKQ